jgi:hypothetical protein
MPRVESPVCTTDILSVAAGAGALRAAKPRDVGREFASGQLGGLAGRAALRECLGREAVFLLRNSNEKITAAGRDAPMSLSALSNSTSDPARFAACKFTIHDQSWRSR